MSNLDIVWSRSNAAALAAQLVADSIKRAESHEKSKARAAEKQIERRAAEKSQP